MDLNVFKEIVDKTSAEIEHCQGDLIKLYEYVGLEAHGSCQCDQVTEALYEQIRTAFSSGHGTVWKNCRSLMADMIRENVLLDVPLDPYFEVLSHLRDAIRVDGQDRGELVGNWPLAIKAARDHIALSKWRSSLNAESTYAREFAVARAARALQDLGFTIRLQPGRIDLENAAETALVKEIESLISKIGGLNLARRIFAAITRNYDRDLQRYHLVPNLSMTGGGKPQVPWGYLLQLSVKHIDGKKPFENSDSNWDRVVALATAYVAILDVQPYVTPAFRHFDAEGLLKYLQESALYDTMFRMQQMRPSDVVRMCDGLLGFLDKGAPMPGGWTITQALEIIGAIFSQTPDVRGPVSLAEMDVRRALRHIPREVIVYVLENILSHPERGANQQFSRPTDAPSVEDKDLGLDFLFKPLLRQSGRHFLLVDRSVCAAACFEALLTALRQIDKSLDDKVGLQAERFLEGELVSRGIPVHGGDYDVGTKHGECDLVVETATVVVFMELKKKPLTRRARAGHDAELLLDLAGSLLAAQAQAGWHELRLLQAGSLDLTRGGFTYHLDLSRRTVERIAVALLDYGSFQDRIFLKQIFEAIWGASFSSTDPKLNKRLGEINDTLKEIQAQVAERYPGQHELLQPFFNCWFLSLPQMLILLDDVNDAASFLNELWQTRHITMGTSDFYCEFSRMKQMKREKTASSRQP